MTKDRENQYNSILNKLHDFMKEAEGNDFPFLIMFYEKPVDKDADDADLDVKLNGNARHRYGFAQGCVQFAEIFSQ